MELDETSNNEEQHQPGVDNQNTGLVLNQQQRSQTQESIDTYNVCLDKIRGLTTSSDDNSSAVAAQKEPEFDFDDRVYSTLRTQFYKQLRGCIKLFRKAAILCDKILPQYLFIADIEEFRNSKILPHLLKAYQLQTSLFNLNRPALTVKKQSVPQNQCLLNLGQSPWGLPASKTQSMAVQRPA